MINDDEAVRRLLCLVQGQTEVLKNTLGVVKALTKRIIVLEARVAPQPPRRNPDFPKPGSAKPLGPALTLVPK